ncbi:MAG: SMP-30/gluconolactonase/LRE family protein [Verrucomicrobiaceae bacterium]|nr:SMP-30/gluconolactonase/LRE family protein [Verrucomicrobiaceae bacterium]
MKPLATLCSALFALVTHAQDTSLHEFLIDNEPWKEVVSGQTFTDGLCTDAAGNLWFTDVKAGKGVYRLDAAGGQISLVHDNLPGISGLQFGADGKLYATHNKEQRVISIDSDGKVDVLATGVKCNDLVVTKKGFVYFTETPTKRIHCITPDRQHRIADEGHVTKPNGISISTDEQTLAVSDYGGKNVWTWRIEADGSLTGAAPYMTMQTTAGNDGAAGDGMTTEEKGRWFVTTDLGVQIFDPAGRLSGIIAKPVAAGKVVSVEFAGKDHDQLFVAAGDKIFSRKLKVKGWFGR